MQDHDTPRRPSPEVTTSAPVTRRSFLHAAALTGAFALIPTKLATGCDASTQAGDEVQSLAAGAIELYLDLTQGFNFRKDSITPIGHITGLKIGETELTGDVTLIDPMNNASHLPVIGVLEGVTTNGAPTDPLYFECQVSETAKNRLDTLTKKNLSNTEVEVAFACYAYDQSEERYYKSFHTQDVALKGLIQGQGGDLAIQVELTPNAIVQEPRNFRLSLGLVPQPIQQTLYYATSATDEVTMQWGEGA